MMSGGAQCEQRDTDLERPVLDASVRPRGKRPPRACLDADELAPLHVSPEKVSSSA
jgi:hypothetical protein